MRRKWPATLILIGLISACVWGAFSIIRTHSARGEETGDARPEKERKDDSAAGSKLPGVRASTSSPAASPAPLVDERSTIGLSVQGRPIRAKELGNPASSRRLLVVGCVHGDECAGIAIARALSAETPPRNSDVWIVFDLNPDGQAVGTRQNARGVDLNRNFPFRWRPMGQPGAFSYSGPRAASEPETRVAVRLVTAIRPTMSIWFHQHLDLVDLSGGSARVERRYARMVGLSVRRLPRYPGSATTWQDHTFPGATAFVVELPSSLSMRSAERYGDAALALAG